MSITKVMEASVNILVLFWIIYSVVKSSSAMICHGGFELRLNPEQMERKRECLKDQGVDSFEELDKERHACYIRCILKREGFLNESGVPIKSHIMLEMGIAVPMEYRAELLARVEFCVDDHYIKSKARDQDTYQFYSSCDSYVPIGECLNYALVQVCQGGSGGLGGGFGGGFGGGNGGGLGMLERNIRCRNRPLLNDFPSIIQGQENPFPTTPLLNTK